MGARIRRSRPDAVLLVSHGSRDPRAQETTAALESALARRLAESPASPDGMPVPPVHTAFLDFAAPTPEFALRELVGRGHRAVRIVPLLFTPGYHLTHDLPAAIKASGVSSASTAPCLLGVPGEGRHLLLRALGERLAAALGDTGHPDPDGVVLAAAGSSSRAARSSVEYLTRELGRLHGIPAVTAFASASPPDTAQALRLLRAEGAANPAVASLFVAPGRLPDAVRASAAGAPVAEPLGVTPAFVEVLALQAEHGVRQDARHDFIRSSR